MDIQARITINPAVRFSKPCVRGTRLTVGDVPGSLASGMNEDDVLACLAYAADRERCLITLSSSAACASAYCWTRTSQNGSYHCSWIGFPIPQPCVAARPGCS